MRYNIDITGDKLKVNMETEMDIDSAPIDVDGLKMLRGIHRQVMKFVRAKEAEDAKSKE